MLVVHPFNMDSDQDGDGDEDISNTIEKSIDAEFVENYINHGIKSTNITK